jgi:hypothetical protein
VGETADHGRELALRALDGCPMAQAHEALFTMADVRGRDALRDPEVGGMRDIEIARRDTGNGAVELREMDRLADHRGIALEELLP